jgi:hypothetical protein
MTAPMALPASAAPQVQSPQTPFSLPSSVLESKSKVSRSIRTMADSGGSFTVTLTASRPDGFPSMAQAVGQPMTLTATTNMDVGPTPFYIEIYDAIGTYLLKACASGTTCSVDVVQQSPIFNTDYQAYVAQYAQWLFPPNVQATSNDVKPSWMYPLNMTWYRYGHYRMPGHGTASGPWIDSTVALHTSTGGVAITEPYHLMIFNKTQNYVVADCSSPTGVTDCRGYDMNPLASEYWAIVSLYGTTLPTQDVRDGSYYQDVPAAYWYY